MYNDALEKFNRYDKRVKNPDLLWQQSKISLLIKNRMFDYVNTSKQKYINVSRYSK